MPDVQRGTKQESESGTSYRTVACLHPGVARCKEYQIVPYRDLREEGATTLLLPSTRSQGYTQMIVELVANTLLVAILAILFVWTIVLSLAYIATKHAHERQLRWMNARIDTVTHRVSMREDEREMSCEELDYIWRGQ